MKNVHRQPGWNAFYHDDISIKYTYWNYQHLNLKKKPKYLFQYLLSPRIETKLKNYNYYVFIEDKMIYRSPNNSQ